MHLHDLGAVDQALTAEGHEIRLRVAPVTQGHRPFVRTTQIKGVQAHEDDGAVDGAGDDSRDFLGRHRHHSLIQQGQAFRDLPRTDESPPLAEASKRHEIRLAVAFTLLARTAEHGVGFGRGSLFDHPQGHRHHQEAPLDAVEIPVV